MGSTEDEACGSRDLQRRGIVEVETWRGGLHRRKHADEEVCRGGEGMQRRRRRPAEEENAYRGRGGLRRRTKPVEEEAPSPF